GQFDLPLSAMPAIPAAVTAARRDTADVEPALLARLDAADAEHPAAAVAAAVPILIVAVTVAAQPPLHRGDALADQRLAVVPVAAAIPAVTSAIAAIAAVTSTI